MKRNGNPNYSILLLNMGGPSTINEIQPFLYNLFSDKDIIKFPFSALQSSFAWLISKLRAPKVAKHYKEIGGGSPILEITKRQAAALEKELKQHIKCSVYIGMRYTEPTIYSAMKNILKKKSQN